MVPVPKILRAETDRSPSSISSAVPSKIYGNEKQTG